MGLWRRRKDNKRSFIVRPKGGKSISQTLNKQKSEPLTTNELNKILKSRKIEKNEIVSEQEIKNAQEKGESVEGRIISLHPTNSQLDNVFVRDDSPHIYDETDLNTSIDLREEQNRMVATEKGIEIQEDIDKLREEENKEKSKE